jgi:hypothetical protein
MTQGDRVILYQRVILNQEYEDLKLSFRSGDLWTNWSAAHTELFLDDDLKTLANQARTGHHFHEFFSAVLILRELGYLSLVEKYQWDPHPQKHARISRINSPLLERAMDFIRTEIGRRYGPDLLVYSKDLSDWFFCEVKSPDEQWRQQQVQDFERLAEITGKPVRLMKFRRKGKEKAIILWNDFHYDQLQE